MEYSVCTHEGLVPWSLLVNKTLQSVFSILTLPVFLISVLFFYPKVS